MVSQPARSRLRGCLAVLLSAVFAATAVGASAAPDPSKIPTGGPIPDRRGFNFKVDDPRETSQVRVVVRRVAGNVYVVAGAGGNIVVQAGDDGLLLVDNNFTVFYDQIMAAIRQISDKPIRIVVNTHSHFDHNQNNDKMFRDGALVFAHPNTRLALMQQGRPRPGPPPPPPPPGAPVFPPQKPVPPEGWPTITSAAPMTFHFTGADVMFIPMNPSHTDGDVADYFPKTDVFAFGDQFTTDYPAIGIAQGGTIENFVDNYNQALEMTTPKTIFVPGHAQLSTRADLIANRDAIKVIHDRFVKMVADGMTLEQIRAARPSKEYDAKYATENFAPNDLQNSTRWYQQMYDEAKTHLPPGRR
jgi:glyoxylase-like metal-dependent hydrolase (beta-lactamase superfamily II)